MDKPLRSPEAIGDLVAAFLKEKGLEERVAQAEVIPGWIKLVGNKIAAVTQPLFVTRDGVLFVAVQNHAWMSELQLMEPDLLKAINQIGDGTKVKIRRLRFQLHRPELPER